MGDRNLDQKGKSAILRLLGVFLVSMDSSYNALSHPAIALPRGRNLDHREITGDDNLDQKRQVSHSEASWYRRTALTMRYHTLPALGNEIAISQLF